MADIVSVKNLKFAEVTKKKSGSRKYAKLAEVVQGLKVGEAILTGVPEGSKVERALVNIQGGLIRYFRAKGIALKVVAKATEDGKIAIFKQSVAASDSSAA